MRKMKKFSAGGNAKYDAKYKRKIEDIKSDYDKAMKGKTGRAAEVAKAKYEQRMADAKDDLAKWTKSDRTETRAGEKAAERNLTRTRKFGAPKPAAEPAKASTSEPAKAPETKAATETKPAAPEKKAEPKSFGEAFRAARASMGAGKTFTWQGKSYSTNRAGEGKPASGGKGKSTAKDTPTAKGTPPAGLPKSFSQTRGKINLPAAKTETAKNPGITFPRADVPKPRQLTEKERMELMTRAFGAMQKGMAEGGTVKKKSTPSRSTPPQPSAKDRAENTKFRNSLKNIKPEEVSKGDAAAIRSGNNSSGMKKGGAVKKYAAGGLAKIMPTADQMGSLGMAKGGKAKMADKAGRALKKKSADTMGRAMMKKAGGGKCYAKGGSVSARADGCAVKGKTKGKMI
jgi:hypothetical protein